MLFLMKCAAAGSYTCRGFTVLFLLKCAAAESYTESYTCRGFTVLFLLKCAAAEGFVVFCTDCSLWSPLSGGQPLLTDAGLFKMPAAK